MAFGMEVIGSFVDHSNVLEFKVLYKTNEVKEQLH